MNGAEMWIALSILGAGTVALIGLIVWKVGGSFKDRYDDNDSHPLG